MVLTLKMLTLKMLTLKMLTLKMLNLPVPHLEMLLREQLHIMLVILVGMLYHA
jgi:hypothetical protein